VLTRGRLAAMLVAALLMAGGNVIRAASWSQVDGFVWGPFARHHRPVHSTTVTGLGKLEITLPAWRPLRLVFSARAIDPARPALVRATLDPASAQAFRRAEPEALVESVVAPRQAAGTASVWIESREAPAGVQVRLIAIEPLFRTAALLFHALVGAATGALIAFLFPVPWKRLAPVPSAMAAPAVRGIAAPVLAGTAVAGLFGAWAIVKPPFQGPDEVQHHLRATLMPETPWVCGATGIDVPAWPFRNPLTWNPNRLHAVIGNREATFTTAQIVALKQQPWWPPSRYATEWIETGVVSYPPLYYWAVFSLGQGATATFGLGPYASVVAYRLASVALASALWTVVFVVLRRLPDTTTRAVPIFALLVLNPMLANMSSIVNPDAVNIPAIVLMFLSAWAFLSYDASAGLFAAATAIAIMTKPSGLLAALAVAAMAIIWWQRGRTSSGAAVALVRVASSLLLLGWTIFYAWSPTHLTRNPAAVALPPGSYVWSVITRVPSIWLEYWGKLGWVEYRLPDPWHWALLAVLIGCGVLALRRRAVPEGFTAFMLLQGLLFVVLTVAAEYLNHDVGGLMLQGRYFLPAALALAPVAMQRSYAGSFTVPVCLAVMNVALLPLTIDRYFGGNLDAWWQVLIFWR
jgi:hypothetical protein